MSSVCADLSPLSGGRVGVADCWKVSVNLGREGKGGVKGLAWAQSLVFFFCQIEQI